MSYRAFPCLLAFGLLSCANAPAAAPDDHTDPHADASPHWGYEGPEGPAHWGKLTQAFSKCSTGMQQSPINLTQAADKSTTSKLEVHYKPTTLHMVNNGHTIVVNYDDGSDIMIDGERYKLRQFHFHHPSEHTIEGRSYDMEIHFVHVNQAGNFAVVALLVEEGDKNEKFAQMWANLPKNIGEKRDVTTLTVDAATILPASLAYESYIGSLTTPPCTEGVRWFVLREHIKLSPTQIAHCDKLVPHNNRPIQSRHGRALISDTPGQ